MSNTSTSRPKRQHAEPMSFETLADWVTPDEGRVFLRLGKTSMYEKLRSGEIPSRRFGRQWRIPKSALRPEVEGK